MKWSLSDLANEQRRLSERVIIEPFNRPYRYVLGVDSSYSKTKAVMLSVAVLYDVLENRVIEYAFEEGEPDFPYIPGYLSFREIGTTLSAIKKLRHKFDVVIVDAQGIAHPRNFGFASHLGILLDLPTIGSAKKRLIGEFEDVENRRGAYSLLYVNGKACGAVLRTKLNTKPLFVSPGHKVDIETAVKVVLETTTKYRLPEPQRWAHHYSKVLKG